MWGTARLPNNARITGLRRPPRCARAFTFIEIIAVMVVLAVIAAVAGPRYIDYSSRARAAALAATLRVMKASIIAFNRDRSAWPPDVLPRQAPAGLDAYLDPAIWPASTPVGVVWDYENWDTAQWGWPTPVVGISIRSNHGGTWTLDQAAVLTQVDAMIDDGSSSTGNLRSTGYGYFYVVAHK